MLLEPRIGGSWSICWQASLVDSKMEFPNSSASCRILPRVHVICEYHFFWQENFTDCDRSFQKILKCPSVFSEIYNKMVIFVYTSSIRGSLTERRILSHRPLAKWWLCCSEVDGTRGADCDPGRREIRWKRQWSCFLDDENEGKWMGLHLAKTYFRVCSIMFASDLCIGTWI